MKKILIVLIPVLLLVLCACNDSAEETTEFETHPPVEITTAAPVDMNEVSPKTMNPEPQKEFEKRVSDIDFDSFEEIEAKDSFFPDASHDKILKSDNAQYFFVAEDIKIHAVFFDEEEQVYASASYNVETGWIEFYGDEDTTWYYNEDGTLRCFVYSYDFDSVNSYPIYTFYNPDGTKDVTRTANGWYTPKFDMLDNEQIMEYLEKYDGVIEATKEYKSTDIANQNSAETTEASDLSAE